MHDDTRQNPSNRPDIPEDIPEFIESFTDIESNVDNLNELIMQRTALEYYRDIVSSAGPDGLDPIAKQIMTINLIQLKTISRKYGMETFEVDHEKISLEDIEEWLSGLSKRIKALIEKLISLAKEYASKLMSGITGVKSEAEQLMDRIRDKRHRSSNELHSGEKSITISSPAILWANGVFCNSECKSEQEIIKFFVNVWPKYAKSQVTRAKKMISDYDIDLGNPKDFEANYEFIGNHQSIATNISDKVLPGNKIVGFKYGALGPELIDAEDVESPPEKFTFPIRTFSEINSTLKVNIATMDALSKMFASEEDVLNDMASLGDAVMSLENRRGETIWKGARESLDEISKIMMELIGHLKPNYDPIVRHLTKVANARNAVCRKELDTLGQ